MKPFKHNLTHYTQPTSYSCVPTCASMLLSHFDHVVTPSKICPLIPGYFNQSGEESGTIVPQTGTWLISQGYEVHLHTNDFQVLDFSWRNLTREVLIEKLHAVKGIRSVPCLGKENTDLYVQSYIDFVTAGGILHIHAYPSRSSIEQLLSESPLVVTVCMNTLSQFGRAKVGALCEPLIPDDITGRLFNHTLVLFGMDEDGNYLAADPWSRHPVSRYEPDLLLHAITTALMECDNNWLQIRKR